MDALYTCECKDGRILTGKAKWSPEQLRQMSPLQLIDALKDLRAFASFYSSAFYFPMESLKKSMEKKQSDYLRSKRLAIAIGILAAVFTILWICLLLVPALRFSSLAVLAAIFTCVGIIGFIPVFLRYISAQRVYARQYPRMEAKLRRLTQKLEKEIFGNHIDYLISGFLVSPEFSLCEDAMDYIIHVLSCKSATNISEAVHLCQKEFHQSPVPRLISSIRAVSSSEHQQIPKEQNANYDIDLSQMQSQCPDLQTIVQLSDFLHSAIESYASGQQHTGSTLGPTSALSDEEETLVAEYRTLTEEEKKRIFRIVHSFYRKQY